MSSFGDDPIKDLGFVVFPASAGLDQRDCLFCAFSLHLWKMRALIMLMRNTDIQVDYGSLASDLYLLQFSDSRGSVFQRWGRDYYSKFPSAQSGQKADK